MVESVIPSTFNPGSSAARFLIPVNEGTAPIHPPAIWRAGGGLGGGHDSCMTAPIEYPPK